MHSIGGEQIGMQAYQELKSSHSLPPWVPVATTPLGAAGVAQRDSIPAVSPPHFDVPSAVDLVHQAGGWSNPGTDRVRNRRAGEGEGVTQSRRRFDA